MRSSGNECNLQKYDRGVFATNPILFTFDNEETNKSYIVYTDNSTDDAGNVQVYASVYYPGTDSTKLDPIETEKEWQVIEKILETIQEEVKKQADSSSEDSSAA